MKTRFPSILGVFAAILMVASFVVPMNVAAPSPVSADPGIMKWDTVITPGSFLGKNDILNVHYPKATQNPMGSEILDLAIGNDGITYAAIVKGTVTDTKPSAMQTFNWFLYSNSMGIGYVTTKHAALTRNPSFTNPDPAAIAAGTALPAELYQVAIAPDDPKIIAVTASAVWSPGAMGAPIGGPVRIFITSDAGANWDMAFDGLGVLGTNEYIRDLDISIDYGGKRDIGFVTANGAGGGRWFVRPSSGFSSWIDQVSPATTITPPAWLGNADYYAIKFSPTYNADSSVVLVYATPATSASPNRGTFYNVAWRDLNLNKVLDYAFKTPAYGIEVVNPLNATGTVSPTISTLNNVSVQLPSDFSGQSSSLRRTYISLDAYNGGSKVASADGIFRMDDSTVYMLMDTSTNPNKSIYTIGYFGTYASGKLIAGERMGFPCSATVPTWFTDSPTTCPIPCWYPALKPTTGAANQGTCTTSSQNGVGAAIVGWNADGSLAIAATGSRPAMPTNFTLPPAVPAFPGLTNAWWALQSIFFAPIPNDESAFAISRNNGETFNQLSLIDTTVDWFNDVAVAPDCTTIYLASVNRNLGSAAMCNEFDSVWRATINPNVAAPLPAIPPLGYYWERVFAHVTGYTCATSQTDLPILRVVPSCTDKKDGEIVGWAAQSAGTTGGATGTGAGVMAWSPDYGDYWAMLSPRYAVQDFAFESSTSLYTINETGLVQRLPYTGTSWSTNLPSYDTSLNLAHTIVAVPDGKVLAGGAYTGPGYPMAYSADKGLTFNPSAGFYITGMGNQHVIFDVDFKNNSFYYMGDDGSGDAVGTVYRNTAPSATTWVDNDMMEVANGASYIFSGIAELAWPAGNNPPHPVGQFGLVQAWTGEPQPALYSAHAPVPTSVAKMLLLDEGESMPTITSVTKGDVNTVTTTSLNLNGIIPPFLYAPWNSAVCRTLKPRDGMPKPGIQWDCLDIFTPLATTGVAFTLEPTSLKYCGCCTLDTNTTLYAIDDESGNWEWGWEDALVRDYDATRLYGRWNNGLNDYPGYTPSLRQGMLWAYTDCLAKKGPILKSPADKFLVGADPVTGRNQQVDLAWEQLCLSTWYQLQIAKDAAFTMRINPQMSNANKISAVTGSLLLEMDATNMTSPAAWIAPGALPEAGAIYYWRIRSAKSATQQIAASPWSEARSFTVKAGFIVNTPYYGVQLLAPNNGCLGCKVKPASFSWSPWKEATKYQFDLAKDPEFKTLVVTATTTTTGYEYSGTLDYSTNYFWRVKALEVNGLNIPSDWSATFSMQTEPAPAPPAPPPAEPATPVWVWVIIAIGAILVIVTLILIFKTRRV